MPRGGRAKKLPRPVFSLTADENEPAGEIRDAAVNRTPHQFYRCQQGELERVYEGISRGVRARIAHPSWAQRSAEVLFAKLVRGLGRLNSQLFGDRVSLNGAVMRTAADRSKFREQHRHPVQKRGVWVGINDKDYTKMTFEEAVKRV